MAKIEFQPSNISIDVESGVKILLAARKAGVKIRFGCSSGRCGTCAVRVLSGIENLNPMSKTEELLLIKLKLQLDKKIRLSCQARANDDCSVDLDFQDTYSVESTFEDEYYK